VTLLGVPFLRLVLLLSSPTLGMCWMPLSLQFEGHHAVSLFAISAAIDIHMMTRGFRRARFAAIILLWLHSEKMANPLTAMGS
jgi:hypothetical protein